MVKFGLLDKFVVRNETPRPDASVEKVQQAARSHLKVPKPKFSRKGKPWTTWDQDKKLDVAKLVRSQGYNYVRTTLGPDAPPRSTIRTWSGTMLVNGVLRSPGRPRWLTKEEEDTLYQSVVGLRCHGVIVDRETLIIMAI